jgi:hypothetical protein
LLDTLIARSFTEVLGRLPNPSDFYSWCANARSPEQILNSFYRSAEYSSFGLSHSAIVQTLYRGALNREPDSSGFQYWTNYLDTTNNVDGAIASFLNSKEFKIQDFSAAGFNSCGLLPVARSRISGKEVQALLDSTDTVTLAPETLVEISEPLIIRAGKTLTSIGNGHYASLARLSRVNGYDSALVSIESNGHLQNVWVSGNRNSFHKTISGENIRLQPGIDSSVINCRIDTSTGYTNLYVGKPDRSTRGDEQSFILHNFISGTESTYRQSELNYTDGISNTGKQTIIDDNTIVNTTDGAIVNFSYINTDGYLVPNSSQVTRNTIAALTNNAYGAIMSDPFLVWDYSHYGDKPYQVSQSFEGLLVKDNVVWSSAQAKYNVVLSVGTRLWFGDYGYSSTGGVYQGNHSGGGMVNATMGTIVSGAFNVDVSNSFNYNPAILKVETGFALSSGYASGNLHGAKFVDNDFFCKLTNWG